MSVKVKRYIEAKIVRSLQEFPAVAIIGPRQCGKSTLAKAVLSKRKRVVYLDLERPSDLRKLNYAEAYFEQHRRDLICLDEIQRAPHLFPKLRSIIDDRDRNGQFIILGSASPQLVGESAESLAGRIAHIELTPFVIDELTDETDDKLLRKLWLRGGFPRSYLARSHRSSFTWREQYLRMVVERDIPQLGKAVPVPTLFRLLRMCAHLHGQVFNASQLGNSLGVSYHTTNGWVALLEQTGLLRLLPAFAKNVGKRLTKAPRLYVRDSGILHSLLGLQVQEDLMGHPIYGASWEGFAIETILSHAQNWQASYYRTRNGSEIDLVLEKGKRRLAIECKCSSAPKMKKGGHLAISTIEASKAYIVAPVKEAYSLKDGTMVTPLLGLLRNLEKMSTR